MSNKYNNFAEDKGLKDTAEKIGVDISSLGMG